MVSNAFKKIQSVLSIIQDSPIFLWTRHNKTEEIGESHNDLKKVTSQLEDNIH